MATYPQFESPAQELAVTQQTAEQLLREVSDGGLINDHVFSRLEKLATACAKLAYSNGLAASLSDSVRSLITWCDHLDDAEWRAKFALALKDFPLRAPW